MFYEPILVHTAETIWGPMNSQSTKYPILNERPFNLRRNEGWKDQSTVSPDEL